MGHRHLGRAGVGFGIGLLLAIVATAFGLALAFVYMDHPQNFPELAFAIFNAIIWPASLLLPYHPAIGDLFWCLAVFGNGAVFAGLGIGLAEIRRQRSN